MKCYNTIIILNPTKSRILFCKRMNDPYEGRFNFVGGKIESGESSKDAAYRELYEETGIGKDDVILHYFMDFCWHLQDMRMEVYAGVLRHEVKLMPEKHPLHWLNFNENFFDMGKFAGEGNIGHMLEILKVSKEFFGPVPLSLEELKGNGCPFVERVELGFQDYKNRQICGSEKELYDYLKQTILENGWENSFVDFYYGRLSEEQKVKAHSVLDKKSIEYLERLYLRPEQIYFYMTEDLFEISFRLSVTEMLFSTYYFAKYPAAVWSNYNHSLLVFTEK